MQALDGLRGAASLSVATAHFLFSFLGFTAYFLFENQVNTQKWAPRYPIEAILAQTPLTLLYNGTFAVSIFFVMSGFVLTRRFLKDDSRVVMSGAAIKRYPRLALPCAAAILFAWIIQRSGGMLNAEAVSLGAAGWLTDHYTRAIPIGALIGRMFIGAPVLGLVELDGPLWSIRIEMIGSFLLFAGITLFGMRRPSLVALFVLAFAVCIFPQSGNILHLSAMMAGCALNHVLGGIQRSPRLSVALIIVGLVLGAYDYSPRYTWLTSVPLPDLSPYLWNLAGDRKTLFETVGAIALVTGVLGCQPAARFLSLRPFQFLGRISFSLYLLHWPMLYSVGLGVIKLAGRWGWYYPSAVLLSFIVTLPATVVLAALFERWVDVPSTRFGGWLAACVQGRWTVKSMAPAAAPAVGFAAAE